jgi:predicted acetyltransferase
MTLRLRPLRLEDEAAATEAHAELAAEDFPFLLDWDPDRPWGEYLEKLADLRRGSALPPGYVPATFLVADVGGEVVGRASIRHELNDFLNEEGGHIGYAVRPAWRGRGHGNEILRQSLIVARAENVDRVLVTCDEGNTASAAIIERHGGRLEDVRRGHDGSAKRRYWID